MYALTLETHGHFLRHEALMEANLDPHLISMFVSDGHISLGIFAIYVVSLHILIPNMAFTFISDS